MSGDWAGQARLALTALSELCPSKEPRGASGAIALDWFSWLPVSGVSVFGQPAGVPFTSGETEGANRHLSQAGAPAIDQQASLSIDRHLGERLAAIDQLRADRRSLRVGWLFVAGAAEGEGGRMRRVFQPLVSRPVRVTRPLVVGRTTLDPAGDIELTPLIADSVARASLERRVELGGGAFVGLDDPAAPQPLLDRLTDLRSFAFDAAAEAGFKSATLVTADAGPEDFMRGKDLVIVAGIAVYATTDTGGLGRAASLKEWSRDPMTTWTAFHSMYVDAIVPVADPTSTGTEIFHSPFLLTPTQREAVRRSRQDPLTVIKGAPGTGKSHTITAIACDALARGESVLVAAKSDATVDALVDLFQRAPGPQPVIFGSNDRREELAQHLAGGLEPCGDGELHAALQRLQAAIRERDALRQSISDRLHAEMLLTNEFAIDQARISWPMLFSATVDLDAITALLTVCGAVPVGWRARRRQRKARRELDTWCGAQTGDQRRAFVEALQTARARDLAISQIPTRRSDALGPGWELLHQIDDNVHFLVAEWLALECRSRQRLDRRALAAVSALGTALRSGRAARREQLGRLDDTVTEALPLWAGTLHDIDDLLPHVPGLFDLVVLDEASSIDQPTAVSALLRGKRGVVVGDPKQLRHVSFLSDDHLRKAIAGTGISATSPLAARLDVRRNSAFDVAAGAAPVVTLNEHFRSNPHLVDFVARRLYDNQVQVATRSPATQSLCCVDVHELDAKRNDDGVIYAEVQLVLDTLKQFHNEHQTSIGVITPFRAQADALEEAILEHLTVDQIESMDLRVGTVHAFQGNERDIVIASLGVGTEANRSWPFVEDPHLFTVLVTRARQRFVIIYSGDPPPRGLVSDYLAQARRAPGMPTPAASLTPWAEALAHDLDSSETTCASAYPTGRHTIDIVIGDANNFYGVECSVHPDGPQAHIERHLSLRRQRWNLLDAYQSQWQDRRGELLIELASSAQSRDAGSG